jgi:hypothetical protein
LEKKEVRKKENMKHTIKFAKGSPKIFLLGELEMLLQNHKILSEDDKVSVDGKLSIEIKLKKNPAKSEVTGK